MVRQDKTAAESCWDDDSIDSDEKCEKYLQKQRTIAAEDASSNDEEDENSEGGDETADDEDDSAENDAVEARGTDSEEDGDEEEIEEPEDESETEASTSRGKKMAKKKADGSKTKADYIREVIAAKQAAGAELRPRDIIAALEKKGVEVNASQVSITLRAMGVPPLRPGGKKKAEAKPPAAVEASADGRRATLKRRAPEAESTGELSAHHFEAAADFIHEVGGYAQAVRLLELCNRVQQRG